MNPKAPHQRTTDNRITLGQLCRDIGLARASVLHYEQLGLLLPERRSAAGYRLYGQAERERAKTIRDLRAAGLSLLDIGTLLARQQVESADTHHSAALLLAKRLYEMSEQLLRLREQQRLLANLLASPSFRQTEARQSKASWVALLRQSGFDDAAMREWHCAFERQQPTEHQAFLQSLGLCAEEVDEIRRWSRPAPD